MPTMFLCVASLSAQIAATQNNVTSLGRDDREVLDP